MRVGEPAWSLPGYDVEELLGVGGTGQVWRARERATGRVVALKRLRADAEPGGPERVRREAALLADFRHPHVVGLHEVVGSPSGPVLVLDHAAGGSLAALLAGALAAAHERGLLHGDVSPANVLYTADGRPLLADLGVARLAGEPADEVSGTAGYLDPAVAAGGALSAASDVYGLAAVCFHALTGEPPVPGAERWPSGAGVPPALAAAVAAGLDLEPLRRPTAVEWGEAVGAAAPVAPVRLVPLEAPGTAQLPSWDQESTSQLEPFPWPAMLTADARAQSTQRPTHRVRARHAAPPIVSPPSGWAVRVRALAQRPAVVLALAVPLALVAAVSIGVATARIGADEPAEPGRLVAGPATTVTPLPARSAVPLPTSPTAAPLPSRAAPALPPSATASAPSATPAASATSLPTVAPQMQGAARWEREVERLDALRIRAYAEADPALLADVYAPAAPALRTDQQTVRRLAEAGQVLRGARHDLVAVQVVSQSADAVDLLVRDSLRAGEFRDAQGSVIGRTEPRGEQAYRLRLVAVGGSWRVASVVK